MEATKRIDKYLSGQMEADEKRAFEQELDTNKALAEELALQKDMNRFLQKRRRREALKGELDSLGSEYFGAKAEQGRVVSMVGRRRWALGIAATLLVLVVAWFALRPSLYEQYAAHPPLALVEKSGADARTLAEAEQAFNKGDYRKALPILQEYVANNPDDDLVKVYLGIAKMEIGETPEAREIFSSLATSNSPEIRDFAVWNLALSFLKDGNKEACRKVLQSIPEESGYYQKAKDLLERLK
ncbi:MAG: hypothetical protein D6816_05020 [Bacteroidetes bacterium]|nr:MAG: hypothetical protein D6816_05020 [Bacteroidota bacterium]